MTRGVGHYAQDENVHPQTARVCTVHPQSVNAYTPNLPVIGLYTPNLLVIAGLYTPKLTVNRDRCVHPQSSIKANVRPPKLEFSLKMFTWRFSQA